MERLFEEFYEEYPDLLFIVEIKNEGELGYKGVVITDAIGIALCHLTLRRFRRLEELQKAEL